VTVEAPPAVIEVDVAAGATTTIDLVEVPPTVIDLVEVGPVVEVVEVVVGGTGGTYIAVGPTPPPAPAINDLWVDTS
jgi:hypothetical protein